MDKFESVYCHELGLLLSSDCWNKTKMSYSRTADDAISETPHELSPR